MLRAYDAVQSNFGQTLAYGGPRLVIFGFICAIIVQFIMVLGLSELASAFPVCYLESPVVAV